VTLEVPNTVKPSEAVSKSIVASLIHGPDISCQESVKVNSINKDVFKIGCDVYVNPIPPSSNISWFVDDDFIQRQRSDLVERLDGGFRAILELEPHNYGVDVLQATLKISGLTGAASGTTKIHVPQMQVDAMIRQTLSG
jgi:hypothetical protein